MHGEGQRSCGCGHEQRRRRGNAQLLQRATLLDWSTATALGCTKTSSRLIHTYKHFAGASMMERHQVAWASAVWTRWCKLAGSP